MTDQELLARAIKFDAGPPVHINGWIVDVNDPADDIDHHRYTIEWRGRSWAICNGSMALNKDGEWEYESMPTHRTENFLTRTRWSTAQEAFAFLDAWRPEELKRALAEGFVQYEKEKANPVHGIGHGWRCRCMVFAHSLDFCLQ
jgi:hypothetical protein